LNLESWKSHINNLESKIEKLQRWDLERYAMPWISALII
jgi:hypothetical protein